MRSLKQIWFYAGKDLKLFTRDRLALFFALLFPFVFIVVFNFLLADTGTEDDRLELHLVTLETGDGLSRQIIGSLETGDDAQLEPGDPVFVWDRDYDLAYQAVLDEEIEGFLLFPEDFTEGVTMGFGTRIEVIADAEAANTRAALHAVAQTVASQVGARQVASQAAIGLLVKRELATEGMAMADIGPLIESLLTESEGTTAGSSLVAFATETIGEVEAENAANFVIPGYLVMFVFFTAALSAERIVRERENNTLERLLASSVKRESILGGIFVGTAAKGLIQIIIFWTVGILFFRIDLGAAPVAVIFLSVLMIIMSSAFGVMLATLVRSERSAGSIGVLASLTLAPLGGCWWPLFIVPGWMQFLAKLTPHGWATSGFNKLMVFGADAAAVVPEMLVLAAFAAVFAGIAVWRFRHTV